MGGYPKRPLYSNLKLLPFHLDRQSASGSSADVSGNRHFSYPKRPRLFHQQFSQMLALRLVSYYRDKLTGPVFLHKDRSDGYVPRSCVHQPLDRSANYFAGNIVQVGLQDNDFIVSMIGP